MSGDLLRVISADCDLSGRVIGGPKASVDKYGVGVFGINPSEFLVLLVVVAVVIGPERLPRYAQQLATWVRQARAFAQQTARSAKAELGPEFDEVDWRKLDPRQYDPRRIVREALSEVIDPDDPLGLNKPPRTVRPSPTRDGSGSTSQRPDAHPTEPDAT